MRDSKLPLILSVSLCKSFEYMSEKITPTDRPISENINTKNIKSLVVSVLESTFFSKFIKSTNILMFIANLNIKIIFVNPFSVL